MIAFFPDFYPDELLYSLLARYYAQSGYLAYHHAAQDLFANSTVKPDIEFISRLTPDALHCVTRQIPLEGVIERHTMFPYYGRFLSIERRIKAHAALLRMDNVYRNHLCIPIGQRHLRFCPLCAEYDRKHYGETYWHRVHQMTGIDLCPVHGCLLHNSDAAISSKGSPSLIPAENIIPASTAFVAGDETLFRLSQYSAKVFLSELDILNHVPIGTFLHSSMEHTKYLSRRGEQRHLALLYADFTRYYASFGLDRLPKQWQLGKLFSGDRLIPHEICMLAMFLEIPVQTLIRMRLPDKSQPQLFDETVVRLHREGLNYRQISRQMCASYDTVKEIGLKKNR